MSFYFTYSDRNIRVNGTLIKAPIVEFYGRISRPNGGCYVLINGMKINAGKIDNLNYSLGDSILVRYIPGEYCVVQERVNPYRYYLYFTLEAILLIIGAVLINESFKGKSIWEYKSRN
ncbi:hypothetical protein BSYN_27820 [Bacteroides sedimenti]|uniref:Uncharacterized protein n=2 Tax=Bacteroides sedimenti TaxID=2136147 RepID=A0ABM8IKD3_9BACE